jgi:hypothetical protein
MALPARNGRFQEQTMASAERSFFTKMTRLDLRRIGNGSG